MIFLWVLLAWLAVSLLVGPVIGKMIKEGMK